MKIRITGLLLMAALVPGTAWPKPIDPTQTDTIATATVTSTTTTAAAPVQEQAAPAAQDGTAMRTDTAAKKEETAKTTKGDQAAGGPQHARTETTATTATTNSAATTDTVRTDTTDTIQNDTVGTTRTDTTGTMQTDTPGGTADATPFWLLPLLLGAFFLSLITAALVAFPIIVRRPPKSDKFDAARRLDEIAGHLSASLQRVDGELKASSAAIAEKVHAVNLLAPAHLDPLLARVQSLQQEIARTGHLVERLATRPSSEDAPDPVAREVEVLGEYWKQFRANKELSASFDSATQDSASETVIDELTGLVPDDLKPTFDAVVAPWREHRALISRISLVPRVINGEIPRRKTEAEELWRMREFANLLTSTQRSAEGPDRLSFPFKSWVTDTFLSFADLYLQRYQHARLEQRHAELQPGLNLVRKVLRIASVEPIEVTPGETSFDSTRHIGRSTTNDPRFADGVITGVVRNGFIEGGQQVIRQPEVIVNRMR